MGNMIILPSKRPWIGGSSIPAILGLPNPGNRTPLTEYFRLIGKAPELDEEDELFFEGRKALEPFVNFKLSRIAKVQATTFNVRYTDPEFDWMRAEIDAENDEENDEFKTSSEVVAPKQFGEDGSDDYPLHIAAQTQWGLMVRPKPKAFINVCIGFDRFKRFPVIPNLDDQQVMRARAVQFMNEHVVPRIPPEPLNFDDAKLLWPRSMQQSILATSDLMTHLEKMADLDWQLKQMAEQRDDHKLAAQVILGDNEAALDPVTGKPVCTWKNNKPTQYLDKDKLIAAYEHAIIESGGPLREIWIGGQRKLFTTEKPGNRPLPQ